MRTFLLRSALFLVCALLITVGIFIWLNSSTALPALSQQVQTFKTEPSTEVVPVVPDTVVVGGETVAIPPEGIKLSTLSIGETQKKALETAGVNTDTFTITKTMIACGVEKLGEQRASEIFAGAAPTVIETATLLPCLRN